MMMSNNVFVDGITTSDDIGGYKIPDTFKRKKKKRKKKKKISESKINPIVKTQKTNSDKKEKKEIKKKKVPLKKEDNTFQELLDKALKK